MARAVSGGRASRSSPPWTQLPEPDRLWIRYAPRAWTAAPPAPPDGPVWLDLARGRLGAPGEGGASQLPSGPFDDVLYAPPVAPGADAARTVRDRSVAEVLAAGAPVVVHLLPGEAPAPEGATGVVDLLDALLERRVDDLARVPEGTVAAVWPLLGGLTDAPDLLEEGLPRLAEAGVRVVQPVAPDLPPADRRRLAEGRDERVFDALFHGPPARVRAFSRQARRLGFGEGGDGGWGCTAFLPRPLPRPPLAGAAQREVAGLLLAAGELCLRLGRHGRGQTHFRAARWIDRTQYDLKVLSRQGNLSVIPWLDPESRRIVDEWARLGRSETVERLGAEYLAEPAAQAPGGGDAGDR